MTNTEGMCNFQGSNRLRIMKITQFHRCLLLLFCCLPTFLMSQYSNSYVLRKPHYPQVLSLYRDHPALSSIKEDSARALIIVYASNGEEAFFKADSLHVVLNADKPVSFGEEVVRSYVTIIPDTVTTFSSHLFATMLYEGACIFSKPRKQRKPVFLVEETDEFSTLTFLAQKVDKKGNCWYQVEFAGRRDEVFFDKSKNKVVTKRVHYSVKGWVIRGRTSFRL